MLISWRQKIHMHRRTFFAISIGLLFGGTWDVISQTQAGSRDPESNLLTAPMELGGEWAGSDQPDVRAVITRMREACLSGVQLISDRQPKQLRVEDHRSGPPHIWLQEENLDMAWIVVDIAARSWSQLAYQFGHELGHVLCNSWVPQSRPKPPSHWLEESMVEAFSIRGLGLLADSWQREPPFPHDVAYAEALRKYRQNLIEKYRRDSQEEPVRDLAGWFRASRLMLEQSPGVGIWDGPAIVAIAEELEHDPRCIADMCAVNRWPARSAVPIEKYLFLWERSCSDLKAPGVLPERIKELFGVT